MTTELYTIKALDNYPFDMEACMEALNYALAYDQSNAVALCLMGRVQWEYFGNAEAAIGYYEQALGADYAYAETYHYYIQLLLHLQQLKVAKRLIAFAQNKHPHLKSSWRLYKARLHELKGNWSKSLDHIQKGLQLATLPSEIEQFEELKARVEKKMGR